MKCTRCKGDVHRPIRFVGADNEAVSICGFCFLYHRGTASILKEKGVYPIRVREES